MGKKTVEKKKKKGRPSLLELQKRSLRLQQENQQQQKRNSSPNFRNPNPTPTPVRRSTRRNAHLDDGGRNGDDDDDEEDDESNGKRKEKKLKLVLRLPQRSSPANSQDGGSDEHSDGSEGSNGETPRKKRKINAAVGDGGSDAGSGREKAERNTLTSKGTPPPDSGPGTLLPSKTMLGVILDRLQKKDTYGVYSEPVDVNELPDYHEVIEQPMDFGTVRKKLSSGAYANLEQFEKDVLLISSNAMRYNAPDTIYFRQARSIQELAKKEFQNLRQGGEDYEPEIKTVRRGRPPGKSSLKKAAGRPAFERAGSDFSSDATLANAGDNSTLPSSTNDFLRKSHLSDKTGNTNGPGRSLSRDGESYGWLNERRSGNDEFPGSVLKGISKFGKKQVVIDENRRNTYKISQQLVSGHKPSVLTTFDGERKQLLAVGVHLEHAHARSLARFAANLGPVAWKVASKKIEKALPSGMKFGPGWVGENDAPQRQLPLLSASPPQRPLEPTQNPSQPILSSVTMPHLLESKGEKIPAKQEPLTNSTSDCPSTGVHPPSTSTSAVTSKSSGPNEDAETVRGINYASGFNLLGSGGGFRPKSPFQLSHNPANHSQVNGFNSGYGFNIPSSQAGKLVGVGPARPAGTFGLEASSPSRPINMFPRSSNNFVHQMPTSRLDAGDAKALGSSSSNPTLDSCQGDHSGSGTELHSQPSWRGKSDSVPPDLNVRFQSPGSPTSGMSQQPDLALQL